MLYQDKTSIIREIKNTVKVLTQEIVKFQTRGIKDVYNEDLMF